MKSKKSLDYNIIREFAKRNNIDFVAIYGSYFKGNPSNTSDIDLIIDSKNTLNNDTLKKFSKELRSLLKIKVDLITPRMMISSLICGYVWRLKEYEVIYGKPVIKVKVKS
jgi:predicted nucleotidyltransferase